MGGRSARAGQQGWQLPVTLPKGLASSVSIRDLARSSLRSKSRCFCSRSDSSSVTALRASASSWCRSVTCQEGVGMLAWKDPHWGKGGAGSPQTSLHCFL